MTTATLAPRIKDAKPAATALHAAVQDEFLAKLQREKTPVSIFLVNGIRLVGRICATDTYTILLDNNGMQLVLKHAISTICPGTDRPVRAPDQIATGADRKPRLGVPRRPA